MSITTPRRGGGLYEPLADINVTPFVDVMLVLLIVFMITAPMLAAGMRVDLPNAKAAQPLDPKEPVIITVARDQKLFVGRDEVTWAEIVPAVRAKLGGDFNRPIYVRGDRDVPYGTVVSLMDQLALNGLAKISLVANASGAAPARPDEPAANAR